MTSASTAWMKLREEVIAEGLVSGTACKVEIQDDYSARFPPLLMEDNLKSLVDALDRCFEYHTQILELDVRAVYAAAEYKQFIDTLRIDQELEGLRHDAQPLRDESASYSQAATAISPDLPYALPAVNAAQGRAERLQRDAANVEAIRARALERWAILERFQAAAYSRHTTPGNAHNFAERAARLRRLLRQDLGEAQARMLALRDGSMLIHNIKFDDPPTTDDVAGRIDLMIEWARGALLNLEKLRNYDVPCSFTIPLVQRWGRNGTRLVTSESFLAKFKNARDGAPIEIEFEVSEALLPKHFRLTELGLAYGNEFEQIHESGTDRAATADDYGRLVVDIQLPAQPGDISPRRAILGEVGLHTGSPPQLVEGPHIENISPVGHWKLGIDPWVVFKDRSDVSIKSGIRNRPLLDFKLHLRGFIAWQAE